MTTIQNCIDTNRFTEKSTSINMVGYISRLWNTLVLWQNRYTQRRNMMECSDRMLKDMGLTRDDIRREVSGSFWHN